MKDHPDRKRRLQLIEAMFAGHSWQEALAQSQLNISRSTAYRLRQLARSDEKAEFAFLDDRHGHPYKLIEPARTWLAEFCTSNPQLASSRVQTELKTTQSSHSSTPAPHTAVSPRGWPGAHLGPAELYRDDVGDPFRPRAGLQSALHGTVSCRPSPCRSSQTHDRGDRQVDLVTVASRF
jgi:transposase